jgi:hypothetical protein
VRLELERTSLEVEGRGGHLAWLLVAAVGLSPCVVRLAAGATDRDSTRSALRAADAGLGGGRRRKGREWEEAARLGIGDVG